MLVSIGSLAFGSLDDSLRATPAHRSPPIRQEAS